jgi:hypothetical protein
MFASIPLRRLAQVVLVVLVCLSVPACGKKKVTKANFDKIKEGMTLAEVEQILGKGTKDEGGDGSNVAAQFGVAITSAPTVGKGETYVWESGTKSIKIIFGEGKVRTKLAEGL